jgi:hypothetical protein
VGILSTLSSNRGVSLVVLVIILTTIGLLGAGIASFMGMKQRSYPIEAQAYQALNIANAGAEFAIRWGRENRQMTGGTPSRPTWYQVLTNGLTVSYGGGSFALQYLGGTNYELRSVGTYGTARREVRIGRFPSYLLGSGLILTRDYDGSRPPFQDCDPDAGCSGSAKKYVTIPITNLLGYDVYIKYIELQIDQGGGNSNNFVQEMYGDTTAALYFDYTEDMDNLNYTDQGSDKGICIPGFTGNNCTGKQATSVNPAIIPRDGWGSPTRWLNALVPAGSNDQMLHFQNASVATDPYKMKVWYGKTTGYTTLQSAIFEFTP